MTIQSAVRARRAADGPPPGLRAALASGSIALLFFGCRPPADETARSPASADARPDAAPTPTSDAPPTGVRLPPIAVPLRQSIDLTIRPDQDRTTGEVAIEIDVRTPTRVLWLHAKQMDVLAASLELVGDRRPIDAIRIPEPSGELLGLRLARPVGPGRAVLRIDYRGALVDDDYVGLFRERTGGEPYVFSQFEISDARRAFPCFDEPGFKIPWDVTLRVRASDVAVASSPVARERPGPDPGMKTIEFRTTQPLPTYLLAFAVGPFDRVDGGHGGQRRVPLAVLVPRGRAGEARTALETVPLYLAELERFFARPYPFEKLDSVAVPTFFGAMENAAHITYGADVLLATPAQEATPGFQRRHRATVAHEIAHQWFGDLVTPAWWDDLWLNESFATWLEGKLVGPSGQGAAGSEEITDREGSMRADALPGTRAIHQPVERRDDFLFLFDPINYGKGATVIGMFERWVGPDRFRAGIRDYVARHAGQTATTADFLAALDRAAPGRDVAAAFRSFLDQPGVPLVSIDLRCEPGQRARLSLRQERFGGPPGDATRWKIPVCVARDGGGPPTCTLLDRPAEELELGGATCPAWVSGNAGAIGYYRVSYGGDLLARILPRRSGAGSAERISAIDDAIALADSGRLSYAALLAALPELAASRDLGVVRRAVDLVQGLDGLVPPSGPERDAYAALVRARFGARARSMSWRPRAGEVADVRLLRPDLLSLVAVQGRDPVLAAEAERLARAFLRDPAALAPDLAGPVLAAAAAARGTPDLYAAYLARLDREREAPRREPILGGLARFRDPALVTRTVELAASPAIPFSEVDALLAGGADPSLAARVYDETVERLDPLIHKLGADRRVLLLRVAHPLCSRRDRDRADRVFARRMAGTPGLDQARGRMRDVIDRCTARHAVQAVAVRDALRAGERGR